MNTALDIEIKDLRNCIECESNVTKLEELRDRASHLEAIVSGQAIKLKGYYNNTIVVDTLYDYADELKLLVTMCNQYIDMFSYEGVIIPPAERSGVATQ